MICLSGHVGHQILFQGDQNLDLRDGISSNSGIELVASIRFLS
jgi:hypothetical protein